MKQATTFLAIIILSIQLGRADDDSCEKMDQQQRVISKNGLYLRSEPNTESQSLCSVPYWAKISVCWVNQGDDTINNVYGNWRMVEYQNIRGYMFDGFLVFTDSIYENTKDFRFFLEGDRCALPNYDPYLYWYGIYKTEIGDSLIKVDITIRKPQINEGLDFDWAIIFETNLSNKRKSKLLIGSKVPLKEKLLNNKSLEESNFLFPGQEFSLWGGKNETKLFDYLDLTAIGNVSNNIYGPQFDSYGLQLVQKYNNYKYQDISEFFNFIGNMPCLLNLFWFGDIDADQQVDLIFLSCGNAMTKFTLLLSSISKNNQFVGKADEWIDGNCN